MHFRWRYSYLYDALVRYGKGEDAELPQEYRGGYHCLKDTVKEEGFKGLFSGAAPAVTGQVRIVQHVNFQI